MPLQHFHPTVRRWFEERIGTPSAPQLEGWPKIREGGHTLIAAPTGTGKTLAAFLWAIDGLLREGPTLPDETRVLYVSPLKALGNDVQKNLQGPLADLSAMDPALAALRVLVRTGDTPASERQSMGRRPPHILVTTPESLYILLTSKGGREILRTVRTVIVDEIHAVAGSKRGAHLALSLERLTALAGDVQRIGLSATQKPVTEIASLLAGAGRDCSIVDVGHRRALDLAIEVPESPLETVCSHETWDEIVARMATLIQEHRTTLVFVNTRKLAERIAARLTSVLGEEQVTSHHGSLARERRLEAERRLKEGSLRALVATASLELGIDIGDVDLVLQVGITPSIAVFLQRVGRSGHALRGLPKGRIFPLTRDELVTAAALLDSVRLGELDRTIQPSKPLDILAQQTVAACVAETWEERTLHETFRRAWPYRGLAREEFDEVVRLHTEGRSALLHRDGVHGRLRATRRATITALTSGGAIPDTGQYRVLLEPEGIPVGSLDEDFAIESNGGDIIQLGNASWRILRVEPGVVRVADAQGAPPTVPFWLGEAPARTKELSASLGRVREHGRDGAWLEGELGIDAAAASQISEYLEEGARALGAIPTPDRVVLERFFDESGGMQLVVHAPFGGRVNRAWGLALRKRFCRGFGFELQAAANEEAIVISLGPQHSFPLEDVFQFLHPDAARDLLVQALLDAPMFGTRWRWNLTRALLVPRTQNGGKRVPTPLIRMRAEDELVRAFPSALACPETMPPGDLPVPWEHPMVRQTIEDCLTEAMDVDGFLEVLHRLRDGSIERHAVDTREPSPFAAGILNVMPYGFLDDAPLEERRTQAVSARRRLDPETADTLGALDPAAVARVREQAWPEPESAEEVHEALLWMGYVTHREAEESGWSEWIEELRASGRVRETAALGGAPSWAAFEMTDDPYRRVKGRLEALGPVVLEKDAPRDGVRGAESQEIPVLPDFCEEHLLRLEVEGHVLRCRIGGSRAWSDRRLLSRIHRDTLERLRREIEPVTAAEYWRFLTCWQHAAPGYRLTGPRGLSQVLRRLAGFEIAAAEWESRVLPARVEGYRQEWLDEVTLSGEFVWGRLWGSGRSPIRSTPVCLVPREDLDLWLALSASVPQPPASQDAGEPSPPDLEEDDELLQGSAERSSYASILLQTIDERGAVFTQELARRTGLLPSHLETGLAQLIAEGRVTCDSFGGLRRLITSPSRRRGVMKRVAYAPPGRWTQFRPDPPPAAEGVVEFVARRLLDRYGVVFRRVLERERVPVPWRDLVRVYRLWELRGDVRGGRFVQRFAGEQYAEPEAVETMRRLRRSAQGTGQGLAVSPADPLNLGGILTPDPRVPSQTRRNVEVA